MGAGTNECKHSMARASDVKCPQCGKEIEKASDDNDEDDK